MNSFDEFIDFIHSIDDRELLMDFMLGLTTPRERSEFLRRLQVVERLLGGTPQHQISKELNVGVATVTRGSREIKDGRFRVLKNA